MTTTPTPAPNPIPPINTDAWADYMISVLTTGGTVRAEDTAALVGVSTQQVRRVIIALSQSFNAESSGGGAVSQAYVDNGDSHTLATALAAVAAQTDAYIAADTAVLTASKLYTDQQVEAGGGGGTGVTQEYVDAQDAATLDSAIADMQSGDAATLAAAQAYTDAHSGTGGVTQAYVDAGDADTLSAANNAATTADSAVAAAAQAYTDNSALTVSAAAAGLADSKISNYDTTIAEPNIAAALAAAKAYTDAHSGTGGVSKSYVDTQDTATLTTAENYAATAASNAQAAAISAAATDASTKANNALSSAQSYADSRDVTTLATAKTYADQYAVTDTGWINTGITVATGYTSTIQYRKRGTRVYFRGVVQINTGTLAAVTGLLTLPAGIRPSSVINQNLAGNGAASVNLQVSTAGSVDIIATPSPTTNSVYLAPLEFFTD